MRFEVAFHADDIRVAEAGERTRLLKETIQACLILLGVLGIVEHDRAAVHPRDIGGGEIFFDRDIELEKRIARMVGDAEAADTEHRIELVLHEHGSERKRIRIRSLRHWRLFRGGCGEIFRPQTQ